MKTFAPIGLALALFSVVSRPSPAATSDPAPLYKITLVARTAQAINYSQLRGATRIDFQGTPLLPRAEGTAVVANRGGTMEINAHFDALEPAARFGPEYLTYVMWAISPEGRPTNVGELLLHDDDSKLEATTQLAVFALIVTAEPYFAVTRPSDVVVLENVARASTTGKVQFLNAKYELLERGHYTLHVDPAGAHLQPDSKVPLWLREARLAVALARESGADRFASDTYQRAAQLLADAERQRSKTKASRLAREAVQTAEDGRLIALKRGDEERLAQERRSSADREAQARSDAQDQARLREAAEAERSAEAERRATAEAQREQSEQARRATEEQARLSNEQTRAEAERVRAEAELSRTQALGEADEAERRRQDADAARLAAEAQQRAAQSEAEQARAKADEAERMRREADQDRVELRVQLQDQLNRILQTRDTARGLVVNMSDVLFESGKYQLQPGAREKLAKIAGIVIAHPGLKLDIEGHTDSVGSEEYNQRLSEHRADAVRAYLVQQGIAAPDVTARGFGEAQPIAPNDTASDRQMNRRVEIVVSGEPIRAGM